MMKTTRRKWLAIAAAAVLLLGGCASAPPENKKPDVSSLFAGNAESMEDAADEGFTGCWKYQEAEKYFYLSAEKEWKESDGETVTAEGRYDVEDSKALLYDETGALYQTLTIAQDMLLDQDGGELAYFSESLEGLVPYFLLYRIERNYTAGDDPATLDNGAALYQEGGAYQTLPAYASVQVTDVREENGWREIDFVAAEEISAPDRPADTSAKYLTACGLYDYYTGARLGMNIPEDVLQSTAYWTVTFREASYDIQVTYQYEWKEENKTAYRRYTVKMPLSYDGLVVILHPLNDTYTEYQDGDTGLNGADLDKLGDRIQKSVICRL